MPIRDVLASEAGDADRATHAALHGRSMTGLSGRHADGDDAMFGARVGEGPTASEVPNEQRGPAMADGRSRLAMADRGTRRPFGAAELRLDYPARPGYRRYWFNDVRGRLVRAEQAGYAKVIDAETGSTVSAIVGKDESGRELRAYLYEIPEQWYFEDMGIQQDALSDRLAEIRNGVSGPGAEDKRYVPQQGIKIRQGHSQRQRQQ